MTNVRQIEYQTHTLILKFTNRVLRKPPSRARRSSTDGNRARPPPPARVVALVLASQPLVPVAVLRVDQVLASVRPQPVIPLIVRMIVCGEQRARVDRLFLAPPDSGILRLRGL
jgi:hypothetical protein